MKDQKVSEPSLREMMMGQISAAHRALAPSTEEISKFLSMEPRESIEYQKEWRRSVIAMGHLPYWFDLEDLPDSDLLSIYQKYCRGQLSTNKPRWQERPRAMRFHHIDDKYFLEFEIAHFSSEQYTSPLLYILPNLGAVIDYADEQNIEYSLYTLNLFEVSSEDDAIILLCRFS